jgi:hypothetical protein
MGWGRVIDVEIGTAIEMIEAVKIEKKSVEMSNN